MIFIFQLVKIYSIIAKEGGLENSGAEAYQELNKDEHEKLIRNQKGAMREQKKLLWFPDSLY